MKFIGKYGEHAVMLKLLSSGVEAYLAIKSNQEDYDITAIIDGVRVKRIQVKSTVLQNKNTNNSIDGTEKNYDYLVIVIRDSNIDRFFVLTKTEADMERRDSVKMGASQKLKGIYHVKHSFLQHEDQWQKIL
ncbi:hypothetical protein [Pseudomonas fluorescens]|uniref:PD(D/E)XK endonuclease domain-containing protein n=1 Tax=Pseudomonas fluorescens TaxID=294 RepID=A0A5E7ALA3_PSEFL|nr:hypothetical protein [Pseudomonas fluorescens]VVN79846.1 hypothetical protein PS691_01006 [Pseudomonas fluorescens]